VSTSNSAANLQGKYFLASLEFLNGSLASSRDTFFTATFDGKGSMGNVTINGTAANLGNVPQSQTSAGAAYTVAANGTGALNFPAPGAAAPANPLAMAPFPKVYIGGQEAVVGFAGLPPSAAGL